MFAIIDVETTGGKPSNDRITEIAILVHNGKRVIESFSSLVNPERPIDPFVTALTGISDDMVKDAPIFADIIDQIEEITKGRIFVAHNVRFDYGMIRKEYLRLGKTFIRKQLCTVRLSQKVFPDLPSYSLGKLCKSLEITVNDRHRAMGDTEATAVLFEKLLFNDRKELLQKELRAGLEDSILPPHIKREQVEAVPEEPGVYYFIDKNQKILYIGKSKNMRKRIISHFSSDLKEERFLDLKNKMYSIDFALTGNELIALLLESDEIKRFMPPFNRAQRRKKYRYGIFIREDEDGFQYLTAELLKLDEQPVIQCTSKKISERILADLSDSHNILPLKAVKNTLNGNKKKFDAVKAAYNKQIKKATQQHFFRHTNFFVIGEAQNPADNSVVWVENNEYKGFGVFNKEEESVEAVEALKEYITPYRHTQDAQNILRNWLKKNRKKVKIVAY